MGAAAAVEQAHAGGERAVLFAGADVPLAILRAAGLVPVALVADAAAPTPFADRHGLSQTMGWRARSLLQQIADLGPRTAGLVLSHEDAVLPQVFATLRELPELARSEANTFFCDLLHRDRDDVRAYNRGQLQALAKWAVALGHDFSDAELAAALQGEGPRPLAGDLIVGSAGLPPVEGCDAGTPWDALLDLAAGHAGGSFVGLDRFEARLQHVMRHGEVRSVTHLTKHEDEAAPWTAISAQQVCEGASLPFATLRERSAGDPDVAAALAGREFRAASQTPAKPAAATASPPPSPPPPRSRKTLTSVATFNEYQRSWFASVRERVADGEPFAVVNANAPQELLQALGIPFVVNQWWASIVAAKQQSRRYAALLRQRGIPDRAEAYSSQGLAALFDEDEDQRPWGGLPRPTMLHALIDTDATRGLFDRWARESGAELYYYDRTIERRWDVPVCWWADLPGHWDHVLEPDRLDLLEGQLAEAALRLGRATGKQLEPERLMAVLDLVNEQEDYYRRTRDLIASAPRAPVGIVDTMPATMVPQWHRGTVWGRDAARAFHDEVAALVASGHGACPDEQVRLMWVGRGLWNRMGFYQQWEASHGAVFVWSMYLALAADGYIRHYTGPEQAMRSLAARFVTMGDELRMPTWGGAWHVKEARSHRVDAAIALDDADPLVLSALEQAGIPVLRLPISNFDVSGWEAQDQRVAAFLDGLQARQASGAG